MIDGNYGFEMETMEFLNILSSSGMPGNVFGILTHLDLFRKPSQLRETKKRLKNRFWKELYQGAKLFYLSGVINGRYPDREVHNLSRFISVMKNPRPLIWRNSHPYCLADRFLDLTPPQLIEQNPKCDRKIALYGYVRGTNFSADRVRVHIPGVGDLGVTHIEALPDPCPTPFVDQAKAKATGKTGRTRLGEKQKLLFAPMSDVGGVLVDKDAVYIDIKTSTFDRDNGEGGQRGFGEQMVVDLQGGKNVLGQSTNGVRLFSGGETFDTYSEQGDSGRKKLRSGRAIANDDNDGDPDEYSDGDEEDNDDLVEDEDDDVSVKDGGEIPADRLGRAFKSLHDGEDKNIPDQDITFADSDSDLGSLSSVEDQEFDSEAGDVSEADEDMGALRWKENLRETASKLYGGSRPLQTSDLARMLYDLSITPDEVVRKWKGDSAEPQDVKEETVDNFFAKRRDQDDIPDSRTIPEYDYTQLSEKWTNADNLEGLRQRFTRANLSKENGEHGTDDEEFSGVSDDSEGDGEFEDLEAAQANDTPKPGADTDPSDAIAAEREKNARRKEELKLRFEEEDREGFMNDKSNARKDGEEAEEFGEDDWYDEQKSMIQKQLAVNRAEFDSLDQQSRVRVEGYKAGTYVRFEVEKVPCEFAQGFSPRYPILIGGLSATEERFGFLQIRIKRHRWYGKKVLKTNDPLIFSLGWRRFQTLPLYSISDSRTRNRMLKYTPEHMHCFGTFYGPLIAPNTGFCCVQSFSNKNPGFRIAATGVVLNVDESTEVVKKLKLTGHPYKIFRNTAFIKDMFTSSLEIAKFEGASIKTVSGVRGQIKRALSKPEGHYRATFEDKILMSDIVFLRAWFQVKPHRFYNPVTNLLAISSTLEDSPAAAWQGMRLTGEIRAAENIATPKIKNSEYRPIERATRHFNPLRVPRQLAADLPFKSQTTQMKPQRKQTYMQKRAVVVGGDEKKARALMQMIMAVRKEKVEKRQVAQEKRKEGYRKKVKENEEKRDQREKRERDDYWKREGKKRKNTAEGSGGKRHKGTK